MTKMIRFAAPLLLAAGLAMPAFAAENPMVGGAAMYADKPIAENASAAPNLTTLVAAVKAAGLVDTLAGPGPFTVFAPTNEAFAKLPAGTVDTLLKPENKDQLTKVLTCHVVGASVASGDLIKMIEADGGAHEIDTLGGCKLKASIKDGMVVIEDENGGMSTVTTADVMQSNGVVHVVDAVILPKM